MPEAARKLRPVRRLRWRRASVWAVLLVTTIAVLAARTTKPGPAPALLPIPTSAVLRLVTATIFPSATLVPTRTSVPSPTLEQPTSLPTPPPTQPPTQPPTLPPTVPPTLPATFVVATTAPTLPATRLAEITAVSPATKVGGAALSTATQATRAGGGSAVGISSGPLAPVAGSVGGDGIGLGVPAPAATQKHTAVAPARPTASATRPSTRTSTPTYTRVVLPPSATSIPLAAREPAILVRVIDGDTLEVTVKGQTARVRLIGMDSPETNRGPLCYGAEATEKARQLLDLSGGKLMLEKDVSEVDRYGRLLRYVWLPGQGEPEMLNLVMVQQGYARAATYPPDIKHQRDFEQAEGQARAQNLGLWGACSSFGAPLATHTPPARAVTPTEDSSTSSPANQPPDAAPAPTPTLLYDPDGPDRDCSDFPTQADAQRFFIAAGGPQRDPHRLDNDHDGVACESLP